MEVLVLGMDFFFSKLIYLWVLGRPKKMGFDLGLSAVICMYVNLSMCVQLFLKRERERERLGARLVIELKNCYLKGCENCSLESVVEIHVFSFYKTKKCVWYHGLNNIFQCSKI